MAEEKPELGTILARLEKVEKENRNLKRGALAILLVASAVLTMGQARSNRTIEAEKFVLKDKAGTKMAEFVSAPEEGPVIRMYDWQGRPSLELGRGSLVVFDASTEQRHPRVILSQIGLSFLDDAARPTVSLNGETSIASLDFFYPSGKVQSAFEASRLAFFQEDGMGPRALLSADSDSSGLYLLGKQDSAASIEVGTSGTSVHLVDREGFSAAVGSTETVNTHTGEKQKTSAASVKLFGKDQKLLWSAP